MTQFVDGPAAGVVLLLRRAPIYLRAVQGFDGAWDALDQLEDQAKSGELIVVYKRDGPETLGAHQRGRSGFYRGGRYLVVEPQPADEAVRANVAWRAWVGEQIGQPIGANGEVLNGEG